VQDWSHARANPPLELSPGKLWEHLLQQSPILTDVKGLELFKVLGVLDAKGIYRRHFQGLVLHRWYDVS